MVERFQPWGMRRYGTDSSNGTGMVVLQETSPNGSGLDPKIIIFAITVVVVSVSIVGLVISAMSNKKCGDKI